MEDTKLIAKKRDLKGSSNSRRLRKSGSLPGVIYCEGKEAIAIQLDTHAFEKVLNQHSSESVLVEVSIEGEGDITALVQDVQHHPVSSDLIHVDLLKVDASKPIQVEIPVDVVGVAAGVKEGGSLDVVMHAIAIECLPGDLIEVIEIDISDLKIGDALYLSQIKLSSKLTALDDPSAIVLSVSAPRVEEEVVDSAAGSEPEVINEKKADEADG